MERPDAGKGLAHLRNGNRGSDSGEEVPGMEEGYAMKSDGWAQARSHRTQWGSHPVRPLELIFVPGTSWEGFKQENELIQFMC